MNGKHSAIVAAVAAVLIFGIGDYAFADPHGGAWGPGWRGGPWSGGGPGWQGPAAPGPRGFWKRGGPSMRGVPSGESRAFGSKPLISISLAHRNELKLSGEQVQKLETLREEFSRKWKDEGAELAKMRLDLSRTLDAVKVDLPEVEKQIQAIAKKRADLSLARIRVIQQGKDILTEDQRKRLRELVIALSRWERAPGHRGFAPGYGRGPGRMGPGYGPGMMGPGYGHRMRRPGYGPGMMGPGYGPGMRRPGYGPGMMGPGYGPGMMGPGYGPGMMGPGYGPGMMGPEQKGPGMMVPGPAPGWGSPGGWGHQGPRRGPQGYGMMGPGWGPAHPEPSDR